MELQMTPGIAKLIAEGIKDGKVPEGIADILIVLLAGSGDSVRDTSIDLVTRIAAVEMSLFLPCRSDDIRAQFAWSTAEGWIIYIAQDETEPAEQTIKLEPEGRLWEQFRRQIDLATWNGDDRIEWE